MLSHNRGGDDFCIYVGAVVRIQLGVLYSSDFVISLSDL